MVDLYVMIFILDIVFLGIQLCDARCRRGCRNNIKDRHEKMRRVKTIGAIGIYIIKCIVYPHMFSNIYKLVPKAF